MTKSIPLTQGKFTLVSDYRFDYLNQFKWYAHRDTCGVWYAVSNINRKKVKMHRMIMNAKDGEVIDHKDMDGLNNQDDNLRFCSRSQNQINKPKYKNNTSGYKGVTFDKYHGKWMVQLNKKGKRIYMNRFDILEDAARDYDEAAKTHFGEFAKLNFP